MSNLGNGNAIKHGKSKTPIYRVWAGMKARCSDLNNKNYGGRGISVCQRWQSFELFCEDMESTWEPGLSIKRINNDGNYEPSNCKWATAVEQRANTRKSAPKQLVQILDSIGVTYAQYKSRLASGWTHEEASTIPLKVRRKK